jgi:hypothetical protein
VIVLDEQLGNSPSLCREAARWYPGRVLSIQELRPYARIEDEEIPDYLLQLRQLTFAAINYRDFHLRRLAHRHYGLICFKLRQEEARDLPQKLRALLRRPEFRTKRQQMGKVISVTAEGVSYYE